MLQPLRTPSSRLVALWLASLLGFGALLVGSGCQPQRHPERELFDEAEAAYRNGHYDRAIEHYEAFLKASPDHQLARLAQERILNIERELEVVMGRRNGPRPIYLRPVIENPGSGNDARRTAPNGPLEGRTLGDDDEPPTRAATTSARTR